MSVAAEAAVAVVAFFGLAVLIAGLLRVFGTVALAVVVVLLLALALVLQTLFASSVFAAAAFALAILAFALGWALDAATCLHVRRHRSDA